jgi:hypothetical protein
LTNRCPSRLRLVRHHAWQICEWYRALTAPETRIDRALTRRSLVQYCARVRTHPVELAGGWSPLRSAGGPSSGQGLPSGDTQVGRDSIPRSAIGIESIAIERCSDLAEPLCAQLAPVRELVVSIPAPRCDHRKHEDPALAKQILINSRIVFADFFGRMGDVELDRSAATRLEVYKEQPFLRVE